MVAKVVVYSAGGIEAIRIAGRSSTMDLVANQIRSRAKAHAAKHRDSGAFGDSIVVENVRGRRGVRDRLVTAKDPLAAPKELGHLLVRDGRVIGYVPGQHSMQKAIRDTPEVR